jgi:hypothetical protein
LCELGKRGEERVREVGGLELTDEMSGVVFGGWREEGMRLNS